MEDKTDFISRPPETSRVWNVSVRGWLAICIIGTVCFCNIAMVLAAVSVAISKGQIEILANQTVITMSSGVKELALVALAYYYAKDEREHISRAIKAPPANEAPPTP